MAEAIGTMIQNIKYISIYKYTAEGWEGLGAQGTGRQGMDSGSPSRRPGRQGWNNQEHEELLTFVLNEKVGRYCMHTPTCSHTYEPNVGCTGRAGL